jgi:hypothetical protein
MDAASTTKSLIFAVHCSATGVGLIISKVSESDVHIKPACKWYIARII